MAATAKSAPAAEVVKSESTDAASATQAELNMVVSDTEDDEEFLGDDLSSFDEGAAPPEKDSPELIILTRKIQELDEAKKWKQENPGDSNVIIKRPEQNPLHPNVYFDKYMGMKKLKAVEQKLKFARGVLRRFSGKDPKNMKTGNRIKLQRAEKILAKIVADHKGEPYVAPKHEVLPPTMTVADLGKMNFRARNRIIIAAKKFIPKIEAKGASERTPWEEINFPFYKEVNQAFPEPVKATPEEVQCYNKKKNAIKAERKVRHREDQLDKALNFIDYLLKYKEQNFTPMTKAKLERSFQIIQKQFKFQAANKLEPSKTVSTVTTKEAEAKKQAGQKQAQKPAAQQKGGNNNQSDNNRKRPMTGPVSSNRGNPAKIARNSGNNRGGNNNNSSSNFPRRSGGGGGGNQNYGGGGINRVADIWSSVGAALNQLSSQNYSNQSGNFGGNNQSDNYRRGGGNANNNRGGNADQGRDNFNSNISDALFNRGSVGNVGGGGNNSGYNDGGRRYNDDNVAGGRNFNNDGGRYNNNYNNSRGIDDFNRGSGSNFNQGGNDFRGNNDFGGNNSSFGMGGGGGNYNDGGFNNSGSGYGGGLDLNRGRGASLDDLFTRNRSRL